MERIECVVIGAGVVGLAIARELAARGREVLILEGAGSIGTGTSSRNSEVVHAGLYAPPDWLKTRLCVEGRRRLHAYCELHHIPFRRCGKLVVATDETQLAGLDALAERARRNGVDGLRRLDAAEAAALEPDLRCHAALLSPDTGIVDSHQLMLALLGDAERDGALLAVHSPFESAEVRDDGFVIHAGDDPLAPLTLHARCVVNAAGLEASAVAASLRGLPAQCVRRQWFARGNYFSAAQRVPFSHLIYPLPNPAGLGIHLSLDLGGQARFGPDVEWVDEIAYDVDAARAAQFYPAIREYWPALADDALQPAYSGIRPKLVRQGEANADFAIDGPAHHGIAGLVNLFGIESPGLTASLAIAAHVAGLLEC
ncbi:MAG: NAD(P)/FAD-dependent oxidoreductase [Pararobbsia sp.]